MESTTTARAFVCRICSQIAVQIVLVEDEQLLCLSDLQALGPQLDLAGGLLPRDVEHGGVLSQARRELQRERRLPDPRLPSH
jgi:hypothetical protein